MPNQRCTNSDSKETGSGRGDVAIQAQHSQVGRDQLIAGRDFHFTQNNVYSSSAKDPQKKLFKKDKKNQKLLNEFKQSLKQSYRSPEKATIPSNLSDGDLPLKDIFTPLSLTVVDFDGEDNNLEEKAEDNEKKSSPHEKSDHTQDENDNDKEALSDKNSVLEKKEDLLSKEPTMEEDSTAEMDTSKTSSLRRIHTTRHEQLRNPNKPVPLSELISLQIPHDSSLDDINEQQAYRQILHGQAGVGKSTLCSFIAWDWACEGKKNSELQLAQKGCGWVFHLSMKNLVQQRYDDLFNINSGQEKNLLSIIASLVFEECLIPSVKVDWTSRKDKVQCQLAKLFEPRKSQSANNKVLWILDGVDDVISHLNNNDIKSEVLKSLLGMPYIFITSRPFRIHSFLPHITMHRYLNTVGFSNKQVTVYVNKYFKFIKKQEEAEDCLKQLQTLRDTVWGVAHVPLLLQLLCIQYQNACQMEPSRSWHFDDNLADLYKGFIRHFFERHQEKNRENTNFQSKTVSKNDKELLQQLFLKRLAFDGLVNEQIILETKTINSVLSHVGIKDFKIINELAFLQPVNASNIESCLSYGSTGVYEFPHLTLQEYCAAWYAVDVLNDIKTLPTTREEVKQALIKHRYDLAWGWMWQFMFGIVSCKTSYRKYEKAQKDLWDIVYQLPRDLLGTGHMQVLAHCLEGILGNEAEFLSNDHCQQWLDFVVQETKLFDKNYIWSNLRILLQTLPHLRRALTRQLFQQGRHELEQYIANHRACAESGLLWVGNIKHFGYLIMWNHWERDIFITDGVDKWFKSLFKKYPNSLDNVLIFLKEFGGQGYTHSLMSDLFMLLREKPKLITPVNAIFEGYLKAAKMPLIDLKESQGFLEEKSQDMDAKVRCWSLRLLRYCINDAARADSNSLINLLLKRITNDEEIEVYEAAIEALLEFKKTEYAIEALGKLMALWKNTITGISLKKALEPAICKFMPTVLNASLSMQDKQNIANQYVEQIISILKASTMPMGQKFQVVESWIENPALRMELNPYVSQLVVICLPLERNKITAYLVDGRPIIHGLDFLLTVLTMDFDDDIQESLMNVVFNYLEKYYSTIDFSDITAVGFLSTIIAQRTLPYPRKAISILKETAKHRIEKFTKDLSQQITSSQLKGEIALSLSQLTVWFAIIISDVEKKSSVRLRENIINPCLDKLFSYDFFRCLSLQYYCDSTLRQRLFDKVLESWCHSLIAENQQKEKNQYQPLWKQAISTSDWHDLLTCEPTYIVMLCKSISEQVKKIHWQEECNELINPKLSIINEVLSAIKQVMTKKPLSLCSENQHRIIEAFQLILTAIPYKESTNTLYTNLMEIMQRLTGSLSLLALSFKRILDHLSTFNNQLQGPQYANIKSKVEDTVNHLLVISDPQALINKYRSKLDSPYYTKRLESWKVLLKGYSTGGSQLLLKELLNAMTHCPGNDMASLTAAIEESSIAVTDENTLTLWEEILAKPLTAEKARPLFALLKRVQLEKWSEAAQISLVRAFCVLLPQTRATHSSNEYNVVVVLTRWVSVLPLRSLPDEIGEVLFNAVITINNVASGVYFYKDFIDIIKILVQKINVTVEEREAWLRLAFRQQQFILDADKQYKNIGKNVISTIKRRLQHIIEILINGLALKSVLQVINNIVLEQKHVTSYPYNPSIYFVLVLKKEALSVVCDVETKRLVCTLSTGIVIIDNIAPLLVTEMQKHLTFRRYKKLPVPSRFFNNNIDNRERIASKKVTLPRKRKRAPLANSPPRKRQRTAPLEDSEKNTTKVSNIWDRGYCICM